MEKKSEMECNGKIFPFAEIKNNKGLKRKIVDLTINAARPDDDCMLMDYLMALQFILDEHELKPELTQLKAENERLKEEISNFYSENINWFRLFNESHPEEVSYILTHKEI